MARVGVLFSGGKDSTLAAVLLDPFYEVSLVTGTFGITDDWQHAGQVAATLGYPHHRLQLDRSVAERALQDLRDDGYPRNGIQRIHEHALERASTLSVDAIADGTRRDDRVPTIDRPAAQSFEDRHGLSYVTPLSGFGREAIDQLAARTLRIETGPSETIKKGDYETELRARLAPAEIDRIFPAHQQSVVRGRR